MGELAFPLAAVATTFLVVVPALSLLSLAVLVSQRRRLRVWAAYGADATFAWIVAPTLVPLVWLSSAALHQSEPARALEACLVSHGGAANCTDALVLFGLLMGGLAASIAVATWRHRPRLALTPVGPDHPAARRLRRVVESDGRLRRLQVVVTESGPAPVFSMGWLRPRTVVDATFVEQADDAILRAALLHELAHALHYDALRVSVARVCLAVNPLGRWLMPELERWRQAREAFCDAEAVHLGGDRLALAEALVRGARFHCTALDGHALTMLCGHDVAALRLRLALLMAGPVRPRRNYGHLVLLVGLLALMVAPHLDSVGLLDQFHIEVERLLHR